jgi:tRNA A37 N6-isopentenylltransferase MiaA
MSFAMTLLAVFAALIISALLAFCLPVWASASIVLAAVILVAIGGAALLLKALIAGLPVAGVAWLVRQHLHRRRIKRMQTDSKLLAIPEAGANNPRQASQRRTERLAA